MDRAAPVLDDVVRAVARTGFRAHGLHVLVGDDTAEHHWSADVRRDVHSVAKGVVVLAVGTAADDGLLALDESVGTLLPDVVLGPGVQDVTLRHLLTMTSGIDMPWSPTQTTDWPDLAREFLGRPTVGRSFRYANASTYTAARALAARVGDVGAYAQDRIFTPLGIDDVRWDRCPLGHVVAGGGLWLRTAEVARIGRLLRDRGAADGRQLVPAAVVDAMHTDWVAAGSSPSYDRYALAGWGGPGRTWRLHGAYGQLVLLDPVADAVVTLTADDHERADATAAAVAEVLAGSS
ncbi:serine hydrolase domain-containing protein [Curtobacterium sp. 20TX0008]|uniref:serine hydrolase domain-containing protein n=1 Tax=Curtobacterium sp. 20TX0008 TaxID=3022018 RepID=UPI00232DFBC8|nr:serine hydrolase [Curtobacterium sp. 20TX0008]MDB6428631.1 serine hydrolase [Curtobacterium sp. 20TX0008]